VAALSRTRFLLCGGATVSLNAIHIIQSADLSGKEMLFPKPTTWSGQDTFLNSSSKTKCLLCDYRFPWGGAPEADACRPAVAFESLRLVRSDVQETRVHLGRHPALITNHDPVNNEVPLGPKKLITSDMKAKYQETRGMVVRKERRDVTVGAANKAN
jgi:hypothetical protein